MKVIIYGICNREGGMMKMGPNNTRCVIWALGQFFFLFRTFFYISTNFYYINRLLSTVYTTGRVGQRKQAQTMPDTLFGPLVSIFQSFDFN